MISLRHALLCTATVFLFAGLGGCGAPEGTATDAAVVDPPDPPCSCTEGTRRCNGTAVQVCERMSASCASWGPAVACATGMCSSGSCGGTCQDACTAGASRCSGDTQRQVCRLTASGCLDWVQETCSGGRYCAMDQCVDSLPCDPACPTGYMCAKNGVCVGGSPTDVVLNVQTVGVSGSVTLNGKVPTRNAVVCSDTTNKDRAKAQVRFEDTSRNYTFVLPTENCSATGFAWSGRLFPGTYRVTVEGDSEPYAPGRPLSDLPMQRYVIDAAFVVSGDVAGKFLNVQTVGVSGSVTLNGKVPTRNAVVCSDTTNKDRAKAQVRFEDTSRNYTFVLSTENCSATGFAWSGRLFPGTYRVTVEGDSEPYAPGRPLSDLPMQRYVIDAAFVVSGDVAGKVLNVQTVGVSGSVTLNGKVPTRNAVVCSDTTNKDRAKAQVRFEDASRNYTFVLPTENCSTTGFAWSGRLFPGTYRVTVEGDSEPYTPGRPLSDLPMQRYVIDAAFVVSGDVAGKVLNVQTVGVSGSVTLNGKVPTRNAVVCSDSTNKDRAKAQVRFEDTSRNYTFALSTENCSTTGFAWSGRLFPGTYRVTVEGDSEPYAPGRPLSDLPMQRYVIDAAFVVSGDVAGKVLNVQTVGVSGSVTLNGKVPTRNAVVCSDTTNKDRAKAQVRFEDASRNYTFVLSTENCSATGFAWSGRLFPGTYRVTVEGDSEPYAPGRPLSDLPMQRYVIDAAFVVSGDVAGKVLNVQTVGVSGSVTLNGKVPTRNAVVCSDSTNKDRAKAQVRFEDASRNYTFALSTENCSTTGFAWSGRLFPGTYRVTVEGDSEPYAPGRPLSDLPMQRYVASQRLQVP